MEKLITNLEMYECTNRHEFIRPEKLQGHV